MNLIVQFKWNEIYIKYAMGAAELQPEHKQLIIHSHFVFYGSAATPELTAQLREETETLWNEPKAQVQWRDHLITVNFRITASVQPIISDLEVYQNVDPRNNFFRIEPFILGNISFVDGVGCNSGYFLLENLYAGSTTAAHEYGHTLGLDHPHNLDLRGLGRPGIMYPRGTLVDPEFQYDPAVPAGLKGGTMHPMHRRVLTSDVHQLKLHRLRFENRFAVVGEFTNVFHEDHRTAGGGQASPMA
ncbi:peptidase M10 [Pseudocnuella soli]|uniref:peptidase M10 n=2 Tax=Chitinophagaceae TaxID=563835 RepID=UPI001F013025|nr:peptidase M10 [Pseudocnuella soli]